MRHKIWKKDDFFTIGMRRVDMDAEAVKLPEEAAVAWNFDWADKAGPYGWVNDLRVEDGEITGELQVYDPTWDDSLIEENLYRLGGFYTNVEKIEVGGRQRVMKCTLRAVSVVPLPGSYGIPNDCPKWEE